MILSLQYFTLSNILFKDIINYDFHIHVFGSRWTHKSDCLCLLCGLTTSQIRSTAKTIKNIFLVTKGYFILKKRKRCLNNIQMGLENNN